MIMLMVCRLHAICLPSPLFRNVWLQVSGFVKPKKKTMPKVVVSNLCYFQVGTGQYRNDINKGYSKLNITRNTFSFKV